MTHESLLNELWQSALTRLGGVAAIEASARELRAFVRARAVQSAADLLRLIMAYCLGGMGLRLTSAWAASTGLANLSNVALLKRLRNCGAWMEHPVGQLLKPETQAPAGGRRIRLLDGTTVPKAGKDARKNNGQPSFARRSELREGGWRLHCAFDLPFERFSFIELSDACLVAISKHRSPTRKAASGSTARLSSKEISPSPTAVFSIPNPWRIFSSKAPMSLCAQAGKAPAGSTATASLSTCWPP
jgi:hypothetical protein